MDELTIGDKVYISSKRAAKITGYAKDYVGQLCREGRVEARLVGRNWYVLEVSILEHRFGVVDEESKENTEEQTIEPSISWSKPVYVPEVQEPVVPVLLKNPETESAKRVVSEMQSAWQEWFATQPTAAVTTHSSDAVYPPEEEMQEVEEEPVHILRVPDTQVEYNPQEYVADFTPKSPYVASTTFADEYEERLQDQNTDYRRNSAALYTPTKVFLIIVMVGAAVAAVLGSGVVGDVLTSSYHVRGNALTIVKYLGGETEFINN